jgi:hypothetical protein
MVRPPRTTTDPAFQNGLAAICESPACPGFRLLTNPWLLPGVFDSLGYVEATRP